MIHVMYISTGKIILLEGPAHPRADVAQDHASAYVEYSGWMGMALGWSIQHYNGVIISKVHFRPPRKGLEGLTVLPLSYMFFSRRPHLEQSGGVQKTFTGTAGSPINKANSL